VTTHARRRKNQIERTGQHGGQSPRNGGSARWLDPGRRGGIRGKSAVVRGRRRVQEKVPARGRS
jgi:hypothetical protein